MKVYVVTFGEYSDYRIHGIYSNKEKAKEIMILNANGYGPGNIEEWDLDNSDPVHIQWNTFYVIDYLPLMKNADPISNIQGPFKCAGRDYTKYVNADGESDTLVSYNYSTDIKFDITDRGNSGYLPLIIFAESKEQAKKIFYDKLAKWRYEIYTSTPGIIEKEDTNDS